MGPTKHYLRLDSTPGLTRRGKALSNRLSCIRMYVVLRSREKCPESLHVKGKQRKAHTLFCVNLLGSQRAGSILLRKLQFSELHLVAE